MQAQASLKQAQRRKLRGTLGSLSKLLTVYAVRSEYEGGECSWSTSQCSPCPCSRFSSLLLTKVLYARDLM
jgi:hypothetical protein